MSTDTGAIKSSSDAVVLSELTTNSDTDVVNDVMVVDKPLDLKTETLTTEPSSGGTAVHDLIVVARVSGDETAVSMDNDDKRLNESSINAVVSSDLLESKSGRLIMETCDHDGGGDIVVQDSVGEFRVSRAENSELVQDPVDSMVSGDEVGIVMDTDRKVLDVSSADLDSSVPPAAVNGVDNGTDLLESKSGTLIIGSSNHDVGDDIAAQDSIGDVRVSGEVDDVVKLLDVPSSDVVVSFVKPAGSDGDKIGTDLLESKSGALVSESSDHDIVVQDSVDKDIGDKIGTLMENSELVLDQLISDAVVSSDRDIDEVSELKIAADLLDSKPETPMVNTSHDQNQVGDIAVPDSNEDSRVSEDEKGIVTENIEKVSDENEVINEEKEGEYKTTDIVWAKVKNYPWWPGQIFDSSSSTDKAKKYSNKKGFLVGYFGDQTFAWNKASQIKPFRKNFNKLEKQSNSKAFFHAVNCALDEVSRRMDFGLACSCLSKEVRDRIKSQVFVNAGIRKEDSKIDGGDRFSTVSSFKPVKVVQSVQELAREHFDGFSKLEVLSVRTQLLAFFRWKGYYQVQTQNILEELDNKLEDESELPLTEEIKVVEDEKPTSVSKKISSKKRKPDVCDSDDSAPKGNSSVKRSKKDTSKKATVDEKPASVGKKGSSQKKNTDACDSDDSFPRKKERSLKNITSKGNSSGKRSKKDISNKATAKEENGNEKPVSVGKKASSGKKRKDVCDSDDSVPHKKERSLTDMTKSTVKRSKKGISKQATVDDKRSSISSPKKLFKVGDSICRIAKQISESPSTLEKK